MNERVFHASQASRLDSPERLVWLPPQEVMQELGLIPGMTIADIGAGTGYFSLPMATAIGPDGKVYAVDIQPEMLALLRGKLADRGLANVECVEGRAFDTTLPESTCDLAFMANVWHELDDLSAVLKECHRILRPRGKIAILDWRDDASQPPGPPLEHRIPGGDVANMVNAYEWKDATLSQIGTYSYLVIALKTEASS